MARPPQAPRASAQVHGMNGELLDPQQIGLPAPPVPADCNLRHFDYFPFFGIKWLDSARRMRCPPGGLEALMALMTEAWRQVPASSLPADELVLMGLSRCDKATWSKVKSWVLAEWVKHSDGRLYHPDMAERAAEAWKNGERNRQHVAEHRRRKKADKEQREARRLARLAAKNRSEEQQGSGNGDVRLTSDLPKPDARLRKADKKEKEKEKEIRSEELRSSGTAAAAPPAGPGQAELDLPRDAQPAAPGRHQTPAAEITDEVMAELVQLDPGGVFWEESEARMRRILVRSDRGNARLKPDTLRKRVGRLVKHSGKNLPMVASVLLETEFLQASPNTPMETMMGMLNQRMGLAPGATAPTKRPASGIASRDLGPDYQNEVRRLAREADAKRRAQGLSGEGRPTIEGECE